jgi:diaminopimelate decarboxylase
VKYLNIGGGLGIIYENESPSTALEFRKAIEHLVKDLDVTLIMEPGRFISGNSGILVTRVVFVKETGTKKFIITDAGMNDLVRPCLYGAYHSILPVVETYAPGEKVDVVGPICESADFFARDRIIPHIQRGAVLAIMSAGAYGFSMSSNYNSRPRAAEVLVEGNSFRIIREKENYEDLIRGELF